MAKSDKSWLQKFRESESSTSVIFGAIVVIVVGILLFNYSRSNPTISEQGEATQSATVMSPTGVELPTTHRVIRGETLWGIAAKYYGDGAKWTDLVRENNLTQGGVVEVDQVLNIPILASATPQLEPQEIVAESTPQPTVSQPEGASHTVVTGDCLWNIAVSVYNDGYRWTDIYSANKDKIANPNLIYAGQVLVLPQ